MSKPKMEPVTYTVIVHREDGSLWAEIREIPGCFASGDSMDELSEALREAMGMCLGIEVRALEIGEAVSEERPVAMA